MGGSGTGARGIARESESAMRQVLPLKVKGREGGPLPCAELSRNVG
jgi:hypothetical protein